MHRVRSEKLLQEGKLKQKSRTSNLATIFNESSQEHCQH